MVPDSQPDEVQYVSQNSIRTLFNESQYPNLIKERKLRRKYLYNEHLKHPEKINKPNCTRSQILRYFKGRQWVVEVHRYWHRTKTINGTPDPKRLRIDNKIYILDIYSAD